MVRRGLVSSRTEAARLIEASRVTVGGAPANRAARMVDAGDAINVEREQSEFVSRGGKKLAAALDAFDLAVDGKRAIDAGASTGGFTDCLLQRGADHVVAVDVGHGQLDWRIRSHPRVETFERTNIRDLSPDTVGGPADLVVADLSFISLLTVAPALGRLTKPQGDLVVLIKPQFEAGPQRVGRGGVIRDADVRRAVLGEVVVGLDRADLGAQGLVASPITGADGNVEFLAWLRHGRSTIRDSDLDVAESGAPAHLRAPGAARSEIGQTPAPGFEGGVGQTGD